MDPFPGLERDFFISILFRDYAARHKILVESSERRNLSRPVRDVISITQPFCYPYLIPKGIYNEKNLNLT